MKASIARAVTAIAILALAMLTPIFSDLTSPSSGGPPSSHDLVATRRADTTAFAQDDEDNEEDEDDDNEEDDNGDQDDDNEDEDEDCDDVGDNEEDDENEEDEDDDNADDDEDDNDEDNEDDGNDDCEEDDSDNDEDDSDNEDEDDNEDDVDEEAERDNGEDGDDDDDDVFPTPVGQAGPPCAPGGIVSRAPNTEVQAVTTGRDLWLALPGDRLSVQAFADTPAGICLVLRLVEPLDHPAAPGVRVGSYIFQVEAFDEFGTLLETLPAQVSVNVNYTTADAAGLDEQLMTLSRLDPLSQGWGSPPGVLLDPVSNWVWVLTTDTGIFVAHVP